MHLNISYGAVMKDRVSTIKLHPNDNVCVVVNDNGLAPGSQLDSNQITAIEIIPKGHKAALSQIHSGDNIVKFNHVIGIATKDIKPGQHVHIHNVTMPKVVEKVSENHIQYSASKKTVIVSNQFLGFRRSSGRAGTRNYIAITATVNCSSTVVKAICQHFKGVDLTKKNIDGIIPITHSMGCAQAIGGLNHSTLNNTLAGWAYHPNVVANLFIGLGCEGTTRESIKKHASLFGPIPNIPERSYRIQDVGGTQAAIRFGIAQIESLIEELPVFNRISLPVEEIGLALNCGGSDAFSSLTANPALGIASDFITDLSGTSVLAEIPECVGAEGLLTSRAISRSVVDKLNSTFAWWDRYSLQHKVNFNNNLSPGNIEGGITTIIEKSLGAVSKGGGSPLTDVVNYAAPIPKSGFALMNTPGFDPVSVTGLVAGGCNIVCFTTGRGSVYGCSIAPTIKISTNSKLFERMPDDIDFDAGTIISQGLSVENVGRELYEFIIKVASGHKTKSEQLNLGWEEFTPWPIGETL